MTINQKRKYLKLLANKDINPHDFKGISERHFTRISPIIKDELIPEDETHIINPEAVFVCREDGKEYTGEQITAIAQQYNLIPFCEITGNSQPLAITAVNLWAVDEEQQIISFLNNNSK